MITRLDPFDALFALQRALEGGDCVAGAIALQHGPKAPRRIDPFMQSDLDELIRRDDEIEDSRPRFPGASLDGDVVEVSAANDEAMTEPA